MSHWNLWAAASAVLALELVTRFRITRTVIRYLLLFFVWFELAAVRIVQLLYRPRFVLLGQCHKRGECCRQILADPPEFVKKTFLLRLFVAYHRLAHNFFVAARGPAGEIFFACGHLVDGRCSIYRFRPLLCRNYPVLPFFDPPFLLPGCGFRVAPRVVAKMKSRPSLPIVNQFVTVHHPTPKDSTDCLPEHFELVDDLSLRPTPLRSQESFDDDV